MGTVYLEIILCADDLYAHTISCHYKTYKNSLGTDVISSETPIPKEWDNPLGSGLNPEHPRVPTIMDLFIIL